MRSIKEQKILLIAVCALCWMMGAIKVEAAVRLGIVKFVSKTNDAPEEQITAITDTLTRLLGNSKAIEIVSREQMNEIGRKNRLNMSNIVDTRRASEAGRLAGCQYILLGAVTQLSMKRGFADTGKNRNYQFEAMATLDTRIIDVVSGRVVLSLEKSGLTNFLYEHQGGHSPKQVRKVMEETVKGYRDASNQAAMIAASRIADKIREELVGEYAYVDSIDINKNFVSLNRGSDAGVMAGNLYRVYIPGEEILDLTGNSLGRDVVNLAVIEIKEVSANASIAAVVKGFVRALQVKDRVELISPGEAQKLSQRTAFPHDRPSGI